MKKTVFEPKTDILLSALCFVFVKSALFSSKFEVK